MTTPIPADRIEALCMIPGLCAVDWLKVPGRTYEDLAEKPDWIIVAARLPGVLNLQLLKQLIIAHGDAKQRRRFARWTPGLSEADTAEVLAGLSPE